MSVMVFDSEITNLCLFDGILLQDEIDHQLKNKEEFIPIKTIFKFSLALGKE